MLITSSYPYLIFYCDDDFDNAFLEIPEAGLSFTDVFRRLLLSEG